MIPRIAQLISLATTCCLVALILSWAFTFESNRQDAGWSMFALFALPLLVPIPGMWRGRRAAFLLCAFLSTIYLFHGLVTLISSPNQHTPGTLEAMLGLVLLSATSLRARWSQRGV